MTPDEIRDECTDIAGQWRRCGFDAREEYLDRLSQLAAQLQHDGGQWTLRREIEVLHQRLTLSLTRAHR